VEVRQEGHTMGFVWRTKEEKREEPRMLEYQEENVAEQEAPLCETGAYLHGETRGGEGETRRVSHAFNLYSDCRQCPDYRQYY
jgi:hypothetical protein